MFIEPVNTFDSIDVVNDFCSKRSIFSNPYYELAHFMESKHSGQRIAIVSAIVRDVEQLLSSDQIQRLMNDYDVAVRYCLKKSFEYQLEISDQTSVQPESIIKLCSALLHCMPGDSVLFANSVSYQFCVENPNCFYNSIQSGAVGDYFNDLTASVYGIEICSTERKKKSINSDRKYDCVISMVESPVNLKESLSIMKECMSDEGRALFLMPTEFCVNKQTSAFRENLLEVHKSGVSMLVVSLPITAPHSKVSYSIILLDKSSKDQFMLVDARGSKFCDKREVYGRRPIEFKYRALLESIENGDDSCVLFGKAEEIIEDTILTPSRYIYRHNLPELKDGEQYILVDELVDVMHPVKTEVGAAAIARLRLGQMSVSFLSCDRSYDSLLAETRLRPAYSRAGYVSENHSRSLSAPMAFVEDCMAFAFYNGKNLVATINGLSRTTPIARNVATIFFKLKANNLVTKEYLLEQLTSDYVIQQTEALLEGYSVPIIFPKLFKKLYIVVPSLDVQRSRTFLAGKESLAQANEQIAESYEDFRKDIHMKKHAIGQTLFNMSNWWKVLQRARMAADGILKDNDMVGKTKPISVAEIFSQLDRCMKQIQEQIDKMDTGYGLVSETFNLWVFLTQYMDTHKSPIFKFDGDCFTAGDAEEVVNFPIDALTRILDNIVANAVAHGFKGVESPTNKIYVSAYMEGTDWIVMIENNGAPLPDEISSDYFFQYGFSTQSGKGHSGIGTYEIKRLMNEFGGDVELVRNPEDGYSIGYKLIFKIANM